MKNFYMFTGTLIVYVLIQALNKFYFNTGEWEVYITYLFGTALATFFTVSQYRKDRRSKLNEKTQPRTTNI